MEFVTQGTPQQALQGSVDAAAKQITSQQQLKPAGALELVKPKSPQIIQQERSSGSSHNTSANGQQQKQPGSQNVPASQAQHGFTVGSIAHHVGVAANPSVPIATVVEVGTSQYKNPGGYQNSSDQNHFPQQDMTPSSNADHHQSSILAHSAISNSFSYNENGMYSQSASMPSYIDAGSHHVASQNAAIYQTYQGQGGQQLTSPGQGVGVNPQAIGVAQQAYLTPGQAAHQRVPISHTTRASPATVQWLLENYETAEGVSLPRSTLYNHYLRHCAENKIEPVNAASFGKLIRSVFLGLKTRRLGTRGNSKYHYYGIRVKPNSPLARLTDDTQVAMRQQPNPQKSRFKIASRYDDDQSSDGQSGVQTPGSERGGAVSQQMQQHQQYLGDIAAGLPELPDVEIDESAGSPDLKYKLDHNLSDDDISDFAMLYRDHCEALLQVIVSLQFPLVETIWQTFWKSPAADASKGESGYEVVTDRLSKDILIALTNYKPVQEFIKESDYILYQRLVEILVPDVLRAVPSGLTQMIRNFAKSLENWLINSMSEMPSEIVNIKVAAVSAFSQTLRRYTSLNHLAQAARAVLQNPSQINQMWTDLNKVDFTNVQEQASWVCQCDESLVQKLEEDFKKTLAEQHSLEQWAEWLDGVVEQVLQNHQGTENFPKAARQFLLKWSFYSSMIIRDLTLRSAASFGSFHLIRLLYDEYMFYLVEHKVADATGKSPLAVMAEFVGFGHFLGIDSIGGSGIDSDMQEDISILKNGHSSDVSLKRESPLQLDPPLTKRNRDS
ncbi:DNA-binding protein RFX2-like isoform X3 [Rhopilema esculentum]|uniref:DNA-binding protein RFX2-like isoform X3 n=1 Tax=Rhopilema esculentum TaxID=499914 RepID=UPI0031D52A7B